MTKLRPKPVATEFGDEWERAPSRRKATFIVRKDKELVDMVLKRRRFLAMGEAFTIKN